MVENIMNNYIKLTRNFLVDFSKAFFMDFYNEKISNEFISTYIDAPNSYGAMLRKEIGIVIDDDFNPQFTIEPIKTFLNTCNSILNTRND